MTADEWLTAFAAEIGAEAPDEKTVAELLDLAATAAHASERVAAPIACFMAGRDERSVGELRTIAEAIGDSGGEI